MKVKSLMKWAPHQELTLVSGRYRNGRLALQALNSEGEPQAKLTVNLPEVDLAPDEIAVKDWQENEGALATLVKAGLVEYDRDVAAGFCTAHVCRWIGGEL